MYIWYRNNDVPRRNKSEYMERGGWEKYGAKPAKCGAGMAEKV
jgi:hypothetical protein